MRCILRDAAYAAVLFAGVAAAAAEQPAPAPARETPASRVYRLRKSAVVSLKSVSVGAVPARLETNPNGQPTRQHFGTGVFVDPRGYAITCFHVVKDMVRHEATDHEGRVRPVRLVNFDERQDLALVKVDGPPGHRFDYVPLWDNEALVGENVFAIGNPFGLGDSLTQGYVAATHRAMPMHNREHFGDLVQLDAGINPGNSGGPAFDVRGELLGIVVAIRRDAQCLAFAIPTRIVKDTVARLMGAGPAPGERYGLRLREVVRPTGPLVEVTHVEPNSPAALQGLREGAVIRAAEGEPVASLFDLHRCRWERGPDTAWRLRVGMDQNERECVVKPVPPEAPTDVDRVWSELGLDIVPVDASLVQWVDQSVDGGLLVRALAPGKWGASAGLRVGDIVYGLEPPAGTGRIVKSAFDVCWCLNREDNFPAGAPLRCRYIRDGRALAADGPAVPRGGR
jgi:serine protease Do